MQPNFYEQMSPIVHFSRIMDPTAYHPVPSDWWIIITDIVNSTQAIENGKYKDVNIAGGLAAMALSNYQGSMSYPFVFGGDGVTFLVPGDDIRTIRSILADTRKKVQEFFHLDLRVGMVPISRLKSEKDVWVAKWEVSDYYTQAILKGRGIEEAEELVKMHQSEWIIPSEEEIFQEASFEGFTCRWKDIPSEKGETVSLIIRENPNQDGNLMSIYQDLEGILGSEKDYHPITENTLRVSSSQKVLEKEAIVQSNGSSGLCKLLSLSKIYIETWVVRFAMFTKLPLKAYFYRLNDLKNYNIQSSDFRKFDGSLKMVVSISPERRKALEEFLQSEEEKGNLFYGMHISDRALLTCLLHSGASQEVHFVDGADGGYALAAKDLKAKL